MRWCWSPGLYKEVVLPFGSVWPRDRVDQSTGLFAPNPFLQDGSAPRREAKLEDVAFQGTWFLQASLTLWASPNSCIHSTLGLLPLLVLLPGTL